MSGRPSLTIIEYFPHYVISKKTIFTLQSLFGNDGYAFWFKLLELLGETPGHSYKFCKKSEWLYLVSRTCVTEERAKLILETLIDLEAIDKKLYKKNIIWCENFVKNLIPVYAKRTSELPKKPRILPDSSIPAPKTLIPGTETPQRKGKQRKGEQSKRVFGEFENVFLKDEEYKKLIKKFGETPANDQIENLSQYVASKGTEYKSHYATILNWNRKNQPQEPTESKFTGAK